MSDALTGSAALDVTIENGQPKNVATGTQPCVVHANGWEKLPLIELVEASGRISKDQRDQLLSDRDALKKKQVSR